MIQRVYEQAKQAALLNEVIVATDDAWIAETVSRFGGNVQLTSAEHPNGTARCAEVARHFPEYGGIVNIQGDEPYIHPEQIDQLCRLFSDIDASLFTQAKLLNDPDALKNPHIVKVTFDEQGYATAFERRPDPIPQTGFKHIGLYGYRAQALQEIIHLAPTENELREHLEQLRWLDHGYRIKVGITEFESRSVDVPDDILELKN